MPSKRCHGKDWCEEFAQSLNCRQSRSLARAQIRELLNELTIRRGTSLCGFNIIRLRARREDTARSDELLNDLLVKLSVDI